MTSYSPQQLAGILYSFKAFDVLPTEIADEIQDVLEDELTQSIRSLVDDVIKLDRFKEPIDRSQVEKNATKDIIHYDDCLDRIYTQVGNFMTVPPHVLLPGDESFRNIDPDAKIKRMDIRNQIKLRMASIQKQRKEAARSKFVKQVKLRLEKALQSVVI